MHSTTNVPQLQNSEKPIQEQELRQDRLLHPLGPVFEVIGSVVEATRLGKANKLDVTVSFPPLASGGGLLRLSRRGGSPVATEVTVDASSPLAAFARGGDDDENGRRVFNYPLFLYHLLRAIKAGLSRAKQLHEWPSDISFQVTSLPQKL